LIRNILKNSRKGEIICLNILKYLGFIYLIILLYLINNILKSILEKINYISFGIPRVKVLSDKSVIPVLKFLQFLFWHKHIIVKPIAQ